MSDGRYCAFFPQARGQKSEDFIKGNIGIDTLAEAEFTGRDLLVSGIQEKCYHKEIRDIVELGGKDNYDLE